MEMHERVEKEINLGELFWSLLFSWRGILCTGLIFAILISGVKYLGSVRAYDAAQNVAETPKAEIELTEEEQEAVSVAKELQERIAEYENYIETSVLMQVNPFAEEIIELQYYVKSDFVINYTKDMNHDYTDDISAMYSNFITGGTVSKKVTEELGIDISQKDFNELMGLKQEGTSIYVTIGGLKHEELEKASEILDSLLREKEEELQQIGSHQLILVDKMSDVIVNTGLADRRNTIVNNITTWENQLTTLETAMTPNQLAVLKGEDASANQTGGTSQAAMSKPVFSVNYVVLGFAAGIFLACVWIVLKVLFTSRLQTAEEMQTMYGLRVFGEIKALQPKKRFLSGIDHVLLNWKNRHQKKMSPEQQRKRAGVNIAISCKKQDISSIYITGTNYESIDIELMKQLKKELELQGIQVQSGDNLFYDTVSLNKAAEIGNILFIEQTGKSIYNEIANEIRIAEEQQMKVLGTIVLD